MKKISIVAPCFNEEKNLYTFHHRLMATLDCLNRYDFNIIYIDNNSLDRSRDVIHELCSADSRVSAIFNISNFGQLNSPFYAMKQASGDAIILLSTDLQDPPELIEDFIREWEKGWRVVFGVKPSSRTNPFIHFLRRRYYKILNSISRHEIVPDATGFGLYDRTVVDHISALRDPSPFPRWMVTQLGYPVQQVSFIQERRLSGESKNNLYTLLDLAITGLIQNSMYPLRIASLVGILLSIAAFGTGLYYLILKLSQWDKISLGLAPLLVGVFFLLGFILIALGLLGEYISLIYLMIRNPPLVIEKERVGTKF